MIALSPTQLAHIVLREHIKLGDIAIDATAGNGHDTLFLAQCVGSSGIVHAFDIQPQAITHTLQRLTTHECHKQATLHTCSHSQISTYVAEQSASAIMFNLGYLPGSNHDLITTAHETILGLNAAVSCLKPQGIITVVCYPGHEGGDEEAEAIESWLEQVSSHLKLIRVSVIHPKSIAPYLIILQSKKTKIDRKTFD